MMAKIFVRVYVEKNIIWMFYDHVRNIWKHNWLFPAELKRVISDISPEKNPFNIKSSILQEPVSIMNTFLTYFSKIKLAGSGNGEYSPILFFFIIFSCLNGIPVWRLNESKSERLINCSVVWILTRFNFIKFHYLNSSYFCCCNTNKI